MADFNFNGDFRRKPQQNLGGSSKLPGEREAVLQRAREDRERRQREKLVANSVVVIQSHVRGFLTRVRLKKNLRATFDADEKKEFTFDTMMLQMKRINVFYKSPDDAERLHYLCCLLLNKKDFVLSKLLSDVQMQVRIRKMVVFCVRSYNVEHSREAILFRFITIFTDAPMPNNQENGIRWAMSCWLHLIEKEDFFSAWRNFMERKFPRIDSENIPSTELITISVSLLQKPFSLLLHVKNKEMTFSGAELISYRILHKFTLSFCRKIIPSLRNSKVVAHVAFPAIFQSFPWMNWISCLNTMLPNSNLTQDEQKNILYAVLSLFNKATCSDLDMNSFCDCLNSLIVSIDNRFAPFANLCLHSYFENEENYEDSKRKPELDAYFEDTKIVYEKLQECLNSLDNRNWVQPFNVDRWVKLAPILSTIIRLEPQLSSTQFKCLPQLAFNRNFIRALFLRVVSGTPLNDEEILSFCFLFCHLLETLHDSEIKDGHPLSAHEISVLVNYAKNMYANNVIEDKESRQVRFIDIFIILQTNNAIVKMLKALHDRNTRTEIVKEEEFHSPTIRLILPFNSHTISFNESVLEDRLPPLQMKLLRILREFPFCLTFHDRVSVYNRMIALDKQTRFHDHYLAPEKIQIRRNFIYEDAFSKLSSENVHDLRGHVRIELVNVVGALEAGVDGGGLLREFLIEATRAAVDPNLGLFRVDSQNRIYPNPIAKTIFPNYRNHFFLVGRLVGKALYEQTHLELPFAAFFIQRWITGNVGSAVDYLATLDPDMHRNLLNLKNYQGDWNSMSIDFTLTMNDLGETRVVELKTNGKDILVDSSNVIEYIHLVADYKINREIEEECKYFRAGICDVIPLLHIFSWREMQTLISGSDKPIDLNDWAANINYTGGFAADHPTIVLFWQVLATFQEKQLRKLLKFVTSCSRPPILGFKDLVPKFGIQNAGITDRLPTSSTCMNLLKLPELKTVDEIREKLLYVIEAEAGFELS